MPYYHKEDDARVHLWRRKCTKCGKRWPVRVLFIKSTPEDMYFSRMSRQATSYAKWADKVPGAAFGASHLPNWPRWARLLSVVLVVCLIVVTVVLIVRC